MQQQPQVIVSYIFALIYGLMFLLWYVCLNFGGKIIVDYLKKNVDKNYDKETSQRLGEKNVDKNQKKMVNNNFSRGAVALSNQLRLAQNLSVYVEGVPCTMIKRHRRDWVKRMLIVRDVIVPNSQIESHWFRISEEQGLCCMEELDPQGGPHIPKNHWINNDYHH